MKQLARTSEVYKHVFNKQDEKILFLRIDSQILKKILIINFVLLQLALLIILITPPARSYEFSIYNIYPKYFWYLIISSIILGYFCSVLAIQNNSTKKFWYLGLLAAITAYCLILFLPVIRGYLIYGSGDVLTHIGYMVDIENNGYIGHNHYPILHLLGFSIHEIANLPFGVITLIIPPFFSILSITFWYILGKEIFDNKISVLILVILGTLPILGTPHTLFAPNNQAILLIPIILYGLIKSQKTASRKEINIILITLSVVIVLFHPLVAIIVILIYTLKFFSDKLFAIISHSKPPVDKIWMIIIIMAIIFLMWSTYIYLLTNVLDPLISSIMGTDIPKSELMAKLDLINMVDVDIFYLIKLGFLTYGIDAILGFLSVICILYLSIYYIQRKILIDRYLFFFSVSFFVFITLGLTIFLTVEVFDSARVFRIARIFSLLIISGTILSIYTRLKYTSNLKKMLFSTFLCVSIITIIVLSAFNLHISPIIKNSNQQVPAGGYYGMITFFENRDNSFEILEHGISQMRYYYPIYGVSSPRINIKYSREGNLLLPDHLGYNLSKNLGSNYSKNSYFLLTSMGRYFYENIYPEFSDKWRFTNQDFNRLESDTSTIRIYSNGDLEVYLIYSFNVKTG